MNAMTNQLSNAFEPDDYFTINDVAKELGLKPQRARQIITEAIKKRLIQNLTKKDGVKRLYAEPIVTNLKHLYEKGEFGTRRSKKRGFERSVPLMSIEVPVFDPEIKAILLKQFKDEAQISDFLREKLAEQYKPVFNQLKLLEEEYESKKKLIFGNN